MLLSLLITGPVLLFVYHRTDALLQNRIVTRIDDRQRNMLLGYRTGGIPGLDHSIDDEVETGIVQGGVILLVDGNGRKLAGTVASWPPTVREPTSWREIRLYTEGQPQSRLFAIRAIYFPSGHRLLFGTNLEDRERMREALAEALLAALLLSIPAGITAGIILHRFTNRRVDAVGKLANRIAAGDLSQRLDTSGEGTAYERLGDAINSMLGRMEGLVEQLRFVTDALAHDLRSPLTRMQGSLERAASECEDDVANETLASILKEIEGMMRLISATLEISRTEAGLGRENFSRFDLGALIRDLCEMYHPLAEESGVAMHAEGPRSIEYFGNRELIGQAVSNLIDNALKYANTARIDIGASKQDSAIDLWVADRGSGIAEHRREEALTKYARLEGARTREGSGLGLSLVRAVARLHGGDLTLEDNRPGLRAVLHLPKNSRAGLMDSSSPRSNGRRTPA